MVNNMKIIDVIEILSVSDTIRIAYILNLIHAAFTCSVIFFFLRFRCCEFRSCIFHVPFFGALNLFPLSTFPNPKPLEFPLPIFRNPKPLGFQLSTLRFPLFGTLNLRTFHFQLSTSRFPFL